MYQSLLISLLLTLCSILSFTTTLHSQVCETKKITFIDNREIPIFGVYVVLKTDHKFLTTSNIDGECTIHDIPINPQDTLLFQGIGYTTKNIAWEDLKSENRVVLEDLFFELNETVVYSISTKQLLKSASSKLKKLSRNTPPYANYYGRAQYEKITEYRDRVLEFRREFGYYFTSGDISPRNTWDHNFRSYIVPAYSARSYSLTNNGEDTLSPLYMTVKEVRYDTGTRKLFTLLRAVQLFGPLFTKTKDYDIQPIDNDTKDYIFSFKTRTKAYPEKTKITCKGIFVIDFDHHRLKSISFDYIDYQLFKQVLLSRENIESSPFSTRAEITFDYTEDEQVYISSCWMDTYWKHNLDENFILIEQPSRQNPASGNLIEKEAFACYEYIKVQDNIRNKTTMARIHLAQRNPVGYYDPELFKKLPALLDPTKAIRELSEYLPIEEQFYANSNRHYYPDNYLSGFNGIEKNDELFREGRDREREKLFEIFTIPTVESINK